MLMRPGNVVCEGGSEIRDTWKKRAMKMDQKCTPGDVVKRERRIVKIRVGARAGQRRSRQVVLVEVRKAKVCGK